MHLVTPNAIACPSSATFTSLVLICFSLLLWFSSALISAASPAPRLPPNLSAALMCLVAPQPPAPRSNMPAMLVVTTREFNVAVRRRPASSSTTSYNLDINNVSPVPFDHLSGRGSRSPKRSAQPVRSQARHGVHPAGSSSGFSVIRGSIYLKDAMRPPHTALRPRRRASPRLSLCSRQEQIGRASSLGTA